MSSIAEFIDRLTGVEPLRRDIAELKTRLGRFGEFLLDYEQRLTRLETLAEVKPVKCLKPPKL